MFEKKELIRGIELQNKSWELLRWSNRALQAGQLTMAEVHQSMSMADAAEAWIRRNFHCFPTDIRPQNEEVGAFANFFASYLKTSYRLVNNKRVSACGVCWCDFCSYLTSALVPRKPAKKAYGVAHGLKIILLRRLAEEMNLPYVEADLHEFLDGLDAATGRAVVTATYGQELLRRTEFLSQGEGVLVLWREMAWERNGKVREGFKLTAELFLNAEKCVKGALAKWFS
jgi:hypothetical protein